jgi:uncharacterized protein (TIGR00269 family)
MQCSACDDPAVIFIRYSGRALCARHFTAYVERRVKRELRKQAYPNGVLAVALSGGKDSLVTCFLLNELVREDRSRTVHAISVDEGISGYRDQTLGIAAEFCAREGIPHHVVSFEDIFGFTLDEVSGVRGEVSECTYCGVFRRHCLNAVARDVGARALATGHNLDDAAQTILMNFVRADIERLARMAPHTTVQPGMVPRLLPLRTVPEKEATLYAFLKGFPVSEHECPYAARALRGLYRDFIMQAEDRHPGTRHRLLKSFVELEACLRGRYPPAHLTPCRVCGEPSSEETCMVCRLAEQVRKRL